MRWPTFVHSCYPCPLMHSPEHWPWWKPFSLRFVRVRLFEPEIGWRLWVYTRKRCGYVEIITDWSRKKNEQKPDPHSETNEQAGL